MVCTVVIGLATQLAQVYEITIINATEHICDKLSGNMEKRACFEVAYLLEPMLLDPDVLKNFSPDMLCLTYGTCTMDDGLCHLFPLPFEESAAVELIKLMRKKIYSKTKKIDVCNFPVVKDICQILSNSYTGMIPVEDIDKDGFSFISSGRGSDWSGKDCNDADGNVYPGRKSADDSYYDSNCNGIWGINYKTGKTWEEELCGSSNPKGIIYVSDSVGAHFHMPEAWLNPKKFVKPSVNYSDILLNELDWPQHGFATGFKKIIPNVLIKGAVDSLYLRLRERNRCNHRDYQNLSKNGASTISYLQHNDTLTRRQTEDNPALVFLAMDGNDVCNNFNDTLHNMTTPQQFRRNILGILNNWDNKLPNGSHVILIGLVDGSYIYPAMAERLHPLGKLNKNLYYKDMYRWFNCLQIGPCTGWLNSNATLRKLTTRRSFKLTSVLKEIAATIKFRHFQVHFLQNPINVLVHAGIYYLPSLIESADSFHPNQLAQPLIANQLWNNILEELPREVLGDINPNNRKIQDIFGDQGGH